MSNLPCVLYWQNVELRIENLKNMYRYSIILLLVLFANCSTKILPMTSPEYTLIYIGDPMCSWCYGITDELAAVKEKYEGKLNFELVMGGLRPYNTQPMSELKDFLRHHWEDVHKASRQQFNYEILDSDSITYDTEPPCRANVVVRKLAPKQTFAFFKGTQKAFYFYNKNMHLAESYHDILKELGVDTVRFDELFASDEMKALVRKDFEQSAEWGVRGFPALILEHEGKLTMITNGYSKSEEMIGQIDALVK